MTKVKIYNFQDIYDFTFAGNCTITIESGNTGKWFTFKIKHADKKNPTSPYFVSLLTGPQNTTDFKYIGVIFDRNTFKLSQKSKMSLDSIPFKAFDYFFKHLIKGYIPENLFVYHSGTCGCCGRKLTTPESISRGLGPVCSKSKILA